MGFRSGGATLAVCVVATLVLLGGAADAAEWGTIIPAKSTLDTVRAQYGEPVKRSTTTVEGYDTTDWVYEGDRAPGGVRRLTISFGLLTPEGFRPELVRTFRLEPAPGVFTRYTVVLGWGEPSAIGRQGGAPAILYDSGLMVVFDSAGEQVQEMIFTPPQKTPAP